MNTNIFTIDYFFKNFNYYKYTSTNVQRNKLIIRY